jgi:D-amino-acid oxidase
VLEGLLASPGTGILRNELLEYFRADPGLDPWWAELLAYYERLDSASCPSGHVAGTRASISVVDCPVYMRFLMHRLTSDLGCSVMRRRIEALEDLCDEFPMIVNCGGLGGGELANEGTRMFPRAGHTVRISPLAPCTPCVIDESDPREPTYVIPRSSDGLLGGTDFENSADTGPSPAIAERILKRCARLVPSIRAAEVLELRVGIRPGRRGGEVRLDGPVPRGKSAVVTCLGHGGVGHTLAWGCAQEIVRRVGD